MLRCAQLNLSDQALDGMTMGMVFDMLIEEANDHEKYPYKATQKDIEAFFGKWYMGGEDGRQNQRNHD